MELLATDTARREGMGEEVPVHPNLCGPCDDCASALGDAGLSDEDAFWASWGGPPAPEAIRMHAERFGWEGTEPWGGTPTRAARKRGSRPIAEEVAALVKRGVTSPEHVAAALDITEKRARALLARAA